MLKNLTEAHLQDGGEYSINFIARLTGDRSYFFRITLDARLKDNGFLIASSSRKNLFIFRRRNLFNFLRDWWERMKPKTPFTFNPPF